MNCSKLADPELFRSSTALYLTRTVQWYFRAGTVSTAIPTEKIKINVFQISSPPYRSSASNIAVALPILSITARDALFRVHAFDCYAAAGLSYRWCGGCDVSSMFAMGAQRAVVVSTACQRRSRLPVFGRHTDKLTEISRVSESVSWIPYCKFRTDRP